MNYLIMKSIIDATISHFACKECGSKIGERDVTIVGSAGQAVNLEVHCPNCHTSAMIKAEINVMKQPIDLSSVAPVGIELARVLDIGIPSDSVLHDESIKDEDILALRDKLKST
jgi:hypothetical protein